MKKRSKPRNPVVKAMVENPKRGSGRHKPKRKKSEFNEKGWVYEFTFTC